jgi:hypothetical protein
MAKAMNRKLSGWRGFLACLILVAGLLLPVKKAEACCNDFGCAIGCIIGGVILLYVMQGAILAEITAMTALHVTAVSNGGAAIAGAPSGVAAMHYEAMRGLSQVDAASKFVNEYNKLQAETVFNTDNTNCIIANNEAMGGTLRDFAQKLTDVQHTSLVNMIYMAKSTPLRLAIAHLYRLCQNGQLDRQTFGERWFTQNRCIDDPLTRNDYLKMSTILDSWVLVPPPQAAFDILNNPESHPQATVQSTWNNLTTLEKKFISARRVCDNASISRIIPRQVNFSNNLLSKKFQADWLENSGINTALATVQSPCYEEISYRAALDPAQNLPAGQWQTVMSNNPQRLAHFLLNVRQIDPRLILNYTNYTDYINGTNPIGGTANPRVWMSNYMNEIALPEAYGLDPECPQYADTGDQATKTQNQLICKKMAANAQAALANRKKVFLDGLMGTMGNQFLSSTPSPNAATPASLREDAPWRDLLRQAALEVPGGSARPMPPLGDWLRAPNNLAAGSTVATVP